jgi:hypothetical protein
MVPDIIVITVTAIGINLIITPGLLNGTGIFTVMVMATGTGLFSTRFVVMNTRDIGSNST